MIFPSSSNKFIDRTVGDHRYTEQMPASRGGAGLDGLPFEAKKGLMGPDLYEKRSFFANLEGTLFSCQDLNGGEDEVNYRCGK